MAKLQVFLVWFSYWVACNGSFTQLKVSDGFKFHFLLSAYVGQPNGPVVLAFYMFGGVYICLGL